MSHTNLLEKYKTQSVHYFENALSSIEAGDAEKAGEFVWGSMAEALKAVAAKKGVKLNRHWDIGKYATSLAKELRNEDIIKSYGLASSLHTNFYEAGLRMEDVQLYLEQIRPTVIKLLVIAGEKKSSSNE